VIGAPPRTLVEVVACSSGSAAEEFVGTGGLTAGISGTLRHRSSPEEAT
jgi:hypothetical protein